MRFTAIASLCVLAAFPAAAQRRNSEPTLACEQQTRENGRQVNFCEMREQTIAHAGRLTVDAGTNGGVSVKGWDNASVLVRSKVEGWAEDQGTAQSIVSQVHVDAAAGLVRSSGPNAENKRGWSVSYEIFVPHSADLSLKAHNGGISIADIRGRIEFESMNGGVNLKRLAGDVEGKTMNGGLNIELAGDRWDGTKLDARTMNGGVNLTMAEHYSAHLEMSTVNGGLSFAIPVTVHGEIGKKLSTDLGSGGPTIHVETTNGGVNIKKASL